MKKSIKLLVLHIFLCCNSFFLSAQFVIKGRVTDMSGRPIEFVIIKNVTKNSPNADSVSQRLSDINGQFSFSLQSRNSCVLTFSSLGFIDTTIIVQSSMAVKDSIQVELKNSITKELTSVTVVAVKPLIERKLDRIVMNITEQLLAGHRTSLDLISLAPGVFVTDGQILLNGQRPARVLINGRMLDMTGGDLQKYLKSLKASDIASIEIIPHPPAEFDASGSGGLINIILTRNRKNGLNGSIAMNYNQGLGKYPDFYPTSAVNYKKDKLTITGELSYDNMKDFLSLGLNRTIGALNANFLSNSTVITKSASYDGRLGLFYDINKNQYLALDWSQSNGNSNSTSSANSALYYDNQQNNVYSSGIFGNASKTNYSNIGFIYNYKTDSVGSTLKIISGYTYNDKDIVSRNNNHFYNIQNQLISDTLFKFFYPGQAKIFTLQANFTKVFHSKMELSFGGKITHTNILTTNYYENFYNNTWIKDSATAFDFKYRENIFAGYLSLKGKIFNIDYKVGLRAEASNINGDVINSNQDTTNGHRYVNVFPSVYLKKQIGKKGMNYLSFQYSERIGRPAFSQLNPFKFYFDNYTTRQGNPSLTPEFTHSLELSYTFRNRYYIGLNYTTTKDVISQVLESNNDNPVMVMITRNTGSYKEMSVNMNFPFQFTKWWTANTNFTFGYLKSMAPEFLIKTPFLYLQTYQSFELKDKFYINLSAYYKYKSVWANIVDNPLSKIDITVSKKMLKEKLLVEIGVSDISYTSIGNIKETSYYKGGNINLARKAQTRYLSISLEYNFSFGKSFESHKMDDNGAAEKRRL